MGREVHFVIAVNVDDKSIYIDDDTYAAKFDYSQGYYDTDKEEWCEDTDRTLSDLALDILNYKLERG